MSSATLETPCSVPNMTSSISPTQSDRPRCRSACNMPKCDLCDDEDACNYCAECSYHFCNLCCEAVHEDRARMTHVVKKVGPADAHAEAPPAVLKSAAPLPADAVIDAGLRTPLQDKSNRRLTTPTAKPEGDLWQGTSQAPLLDREQPPARLQRAAPGASAPDASSIAPAPPVQSSFDGARPPTNIDMSVVYSLPAAAAEPTTYGRDTNSSTSNGSSLAVLPPLSRTQTNARAALSSQLAQIPRMVPRNEDILNDLLSLYGNNQSRPHTALRAASPSAALPLNHMSVYSSGSGMQPSAGLRSMCSYDPKRSTPTNVVDPLRMSMNDIDVLQGSGATPSIWAAAAGRASPSNNLSATLPNGDLYSSNGGTARGFVSSLDMHDPKRVTRSDIVSAQWPWQQENAAPVRELNFADRPSGPTSLHIESLLRPGLKPPTGNALGIETPKCGLGIRLRHSSRGLLSVASILPGGAADSSGLLKESDQILAVDGAETCGKPIQDVAKMFVGDEGTTVTLRISCANTPPHDVCLVRKAFHHAQPPVSAPIPAATKTAVGVGIPPRTPSVSGGTSSHPPIRTEETVSTNTSKSSESTTGFSSVSRSTVAVLEPKDKDNVQSPPKAISAVFEQSLQVRPLHLHDDTPLFDRPSTSVSVTTDPRPIRSPALSPEPTMPEESAATSSPSSTGATTAHAGGGSSDVNSYISPLPPANAYLGQLSTTSPPPQAAELSRGIPAGIPEEYLNCTSVQFTPSKVHTQKSVKQLSTPMSPRTKSALLNNVQASPSESAAVAPISMQSLSAPEPAAAADVDELVDFPLGDFCNRGLSATEKEGPERASPTSELCVPASSPVPPAAEGCEPAPAAAPVDAIEPHDHDSERGVKPQTSLAKLRAAFEKPAPSVSATGTGEVDDSMGRQIQGPCGDPVTAQIQGPCGDPVTAQISGTPPKDALRDDLSISTAASTDGQISGRYTVMPSPTNGQPPSEVAGEQPVISCTPSNQKNASETKSSVPTHWKIDPDKVLMEGWLSKETKGNFFSSTQKRWCVLKLGNLSYFHKQTDKAPSASIDLVNILGVNVDSTKNTHALVVTCRDRVYKFVQSDKSSCFKWLQAITEAIPSAPVAGQ